MRRKSESIESPLGVYSLKGRTDKPLPAAGFLPVTDDFIEAAPDYMEKEAADRLMPFVRRPVVYTWEEGKFSVMP